MQDFGVAAALTTVTPATTDPQADLAVDASAIKLLGNCKDLLFSAPGSMGRGLNKQSDPCKLLPLKYTALILGHRHGKWLRRLDQHQEFIVLVTVRLQSCDCSCCKRLANELASKSS